MEAADSSTGTLKYSPRDYIKLHTQRGSLPANIAAKL